MKKFIFIALLGVSSLALASQTKVSSFYSESGRIIEKGLTKEDFLEKTGTKQRPEIIKDYDSRGFPILTEVYTLNIESMIYKVYIFRGKIIGITSDYS